MLYVKTELCFKYLHKDNILRSELQLRVPTIFAINKEFTDFLNKNVKREIQL